MEKLTADEREELRDMVLNHDGVRALEKELLRHVESMQQDVLTASFADDGRHIVHARLMADGAKKLYSNFVTQLQRIRTEKARDKDDEPRSKRS